MNLNDYSFEEKDPNEPKRPLSGKPFEESLAEEEKKVTFEPLSIFGNVEEVLRLLCYELAAIPMIIDGGELHLVHWDCGTCSTCPRDLRSKCAHEFGTHECMATYKVNDPDILRKNNWLYMLIHSGRLDNIVRRRNDMRLEGKAV